MKKRASVLAVGLVTLSLVLTGCGNSLDNSVSNNPTHSAPTATANSVDNSWVPTGFGTHDSYSFVSTGIAFQIQDASKNPIQQKEWCGGFEATNYCAFISVLAHDACAPSGTLQLFDASGNVIGSAYTGDQNSSDQVSLSPGQKTVLVFRLTRDVSKWNLTSLTC